MMETQLLFVHALSPLHPGTGQGTGVIDLPIAREQATDIPYLPGSSLKGALRDRCPADARGIIFGPDRIAATADAAAGALQVTDLRLLVFPVRSIAGTFAWVTSPYLLRRFARDARDVGAQPPVLPSGPDDMVSILTTGAKTLIAAEKPAGGKRQEMVYLEDFDLVAREDTAVKGWGQWLAKLLFPTEEAFFAERLAVVHDDLMTFLHKNATEVIARIKMQEDTKTVAQGGLWYEEALPTESILSGLAIANDAPTMNASAIFATLSGITAQTMQLGGKATVGRGLCRIVLTKGA